LALLGTAGLKEPGPHIKEILAYSDWYRHYLQPWRVVDESPEETAREKLAEEYKQRIGDINDPVFAAKLEKELQLLKQEGDAAFRQTEAMRKHAEKLNRVTQAQQRQRRVVS
jgi:hypothetical protein